MVSNSIASEDVIVDDLYADKYDEELSEIEDMSSESTGTNSKTTKRIHDKAFLPIDPLQDYAHDTAFEDTVEKTIEEFEVSTVLMFALGVTILFIAGTKLIGAGYCSSRSPSVSELLDSEARRSTNRSRGLSTTEGLPDENHPFVDVFEDIPVQNQNNAGANQQV